ALGFRISYQSLGLSSRMPRLRHVPFVQASFVVVLARRKPEQLHGFPNEVKGAGDHYKIVLCGVPPSLVERAMLAHLSFRICTAARFCQAMRFGAAFAMDG